MTPETAQAIIDHQERMTARKEARQARETGTLHVAKQDGRIAFTEAVTQWEPRLTQPQPDRAQRLESKVLHDLERTANKAVQQIQPEGQTKAQRRTSSKGRQEPSR